MATTTAAPAAAQVLAQHGFCIPTEEDILAALNLTREEFCCRHGFDPHSEAGLDKAARQLTLHMIQGIQRALISCGVAAEDATKVAREAIIDSSSDFSQDNPHRGLARGFEHTNEDVELFLAMNNSDRPRLPAAGQPGNLQHGPGRDARRDPFIGWPGLSPDLLAVQSPKPIEFSRTIVNSSRHPVDCVDPRLLIASPDEPEVRSITTESSAEHTAMQPITAEPDAEPTAMQSIEMHDALQDDIKLEPEADRPRSLSPFLPSPDLTPQRADSGRDPLQRSQPTKPSQKDW